MAGKPVGLHFYADPSPRTGQMKCPIHLQIATTADRYLDFLKLHMVRISESKVGNEWLCHLRMAYISQGFA